MTSYMREWVELARWCYIEQIKATVYDHVDRFDADITEETHEPSTVHVPP